MTLDNSNHSSVWVSYTAAADFWGDSQHSQLSIRKNTRFLVDIRQHGQPGWLWGTTGDKTGWVPEWAAEVDEKPQQQHKQLRRQRRSRDRINPMLDRITEKNHDSFELNSTTDYSRRRSRRHSVTGDRDTSWRIKLDSMENLATMNNNKTSYRKDRSYKSTEAVSRLAAITGLKVKTASKSCHNRSISSLSTESLTSRGSSRRSTGSFRDSSRRSSSNKKNSAFDDLDKSGGKKPLFGKLSKMTRRLSSQSGLNLVTTPQA
eukprot:CAMPEP_0116132974 /NCGR_PEP_ID=MMETSP0329-20121206/9850_1 /TAXON_ID=697910 /ORGANISM="Pseudo-nitzschia arenysensis, Strain B593" /LENGTH=260 /DNA_ID=CAMNT_0003627557 /DNA_START=121 /DNA_END=903 /DNA_ORIENTATION=-